MGVDAYIIWLEGIGPEQVRELASVRAIAAQGVDARLLPLPLTEKFNCYYQSLTGMGSGKLGRFDAVRPVGYNAELTADTPEGAWKRTLPDLINAGGLTAALLETDAENALDALECAVADCVILRLHAAGSVAPDALDAIVKRCAERAGNSGHVIVLSDVWTPLPRRLVNVNNFLDDVGLLETWPQPNGEIVWPETLAYGLGTGQVWINMRGREPHGIVEPGREYDEVRSALIDMLRNDWRDPETNEPVITQVLTKEASYVGEHCFKAPDVVVVYRDGYAPSPRAIALELDDTSVQPSGQQTNAPVGEPLACLIGRGPNLAIRAEVTNRLIDVVPSMLYLLGLSIPKHIDGQVITEMFSPTYREQVPIHQVESDATSLSGEEENVIVGRLQALGYLG